MFVLRPSVINPTLWQESHTPDPQWDTTRRRVLTVFDFRCAGCNHRSTRGMHAHHTHDTTDFRGSLLPLCAACHAVVHVGRSLALGVLEIWKTPTSQREIVQHTRAQIAAGATLTQIKAGFDLTPGPYAATSVEYANEILETLGTKPIGTLPAPYSAIFVNFTSWQLTASERNPVST